MRNSSSRTPRRRSGILGRVVYLALVLGLVSCDLTEPTRKAHVDVSDLGYWEEVGGGLWVVTAEARNVGTGCATDIRITSVAFTEQGTRIRSATWDRAGLVSPGERFFYSSLMMPASQAAQVAKVEREASWADTACS